MPPYVLLDPRTNKGQASADTIVVTTTQTIGINRGAKAAVQANQDRIVPNWANGIPEAEKCVEMVDPGSYRTGGHPIQLPGAGPFLHRGRWCVLEAVVCMCQRAWEDCLLLVGWRRAVEIMSLQTSALHLALFLVVL